MSVTKVTSMMSTGTKGGDIPSASTLVIDTDGDFFDITGTTGITAMTVDAGRRFTLQFDGAVVLTHGSSLYLPGAVNFTTEANDSLDFIATAANTVRCTGYALKDGGSPVAAGVADVKFLAFNSATDSNVTGNGTTVTVDFDTEVYDTGDDFASDTFTAPSTGKYLLTLSVMVSGMTSAADVAELKLVTSNRTYEDEEHNIDKIANAQYTGSMTAIADMDASDTAHVTIAITGIGADTADIAGSGTILHTYFSGALLA
jgi:hypothetical protein